MQITNTEGIHMSFAVWLTADNYDYDRRENAVSATKLLDSTRQIVLGSRMAKVENEDGIDLTRLIPSSLGNAIHDSAEMAWRENHAKSLRRLGYSDKLIKRVQINPKPHELKPNTIPIYLEQRAEREINGFIVTGKYDAIMDGQIIDYKSTGTYTFMNLKSNEKKYILQESIYRWLNEDKVTCDVGLINFIFTDWSKLQSMIQGKKGYPSSRLITHKITLMPVKEIEAFIVHKLSRIKYFMQAQNEDLPPCSQEELWQSDTVFKYFKNPQGKRATKNFDNFPEAEGRRLKDGGGGIVKEFRGMVKRCIYCNGAPICNQAKQLIVDGLLDLEG